MTARRIFEIRDSRGVVMALRTMDPDEDTETGPRPMLVLEVSNDSNHYMDGAELEALHQFTYETLAGQQDPKLRDVIRCDFRWTTGSWTHGCDLHKGHRYPSENVDHVTLDGITHLIDPPF